MPETSIWFTITPVPFLSVLVWVVLITAVMTIARRAFHDAVGSLSRLVYNAMRMAAAAVKMTRQRMEAHNREVLLADGIEHAERLTEREFARISSVVERNLDTYPQLQRQIQDDLLKLEEDYRKTAETPQGLADWGKVIDAIAGIQPPGDPMAADILEAIHKRLKDQHEVALDSHRKAVSARHAILSRMVPKWHATHNTLKGIEKAIGNLTGRSQAVDRHMTDYETIRAKSDRARHRLSSSSLTRLFTSFLAVGVFIIGAVINFNLVALPMSEMVGDASYIGMFQTSDVAAVFIVSLQFVLGIFIMDALGFTRLFSVIGCLDDKKRTWFFWILLIMLTILAGVETSLAFMRDRMAAEMEALRQSLAGIEPSAVAAINIATVGQMILGFILPFILATAAIPFEALISSMRTVLGMTAVWALGTLSFLLRLMGNLAYYLGRLVVKVYDLLIFPALWLETLIRRKRAATQAVRPAPRSRKAQPCPTKKTVTMLEEAAVNKKSAS